MIGYYILLFSVRLLYRWYYGNINRQKAEKLLFSSENKTGSFLVRISESHSDEYTISGASPYFYLLIVSRPTASTLFLVFLLWIIFIFFLFSSPVFYLICSLRFINLIILCIRHPLSAYPPSVQTSISFSSSLSVSLFHPF